jgi:hypothetical protein
MIGNGLTLVKRLFTIALAGTIVLSFAERALAQGQNVPACFATPPSLASDGSFVLSQAFGPCDELDEILASTNPQDIAWISGTGLNGIIGLNQGGFASDSYAVEFRVSPQFNSVFSTGQNELVRFGNDAPSAQRGRWWTTLETVQSSNGSLVGLTDLEERLALPPASVPHAIAYGSGVAAGAVGYFGIVASAFGHAGGAVQFWFPTGPVNVSKVQTLQLAP